MQKNCDRSTPETLKGAGPCNIVNEMKKRNGTPQWWCRTHAQEASDPTGNPLAGCPASWFEPVSESSQCEIDVSTEFFSVWGAIRPAIEIGECPREPGGVHVHRRVQAGGEKDVDGSFEIVRLSAGDVFVEVESMAAKAYSVSELCGEEVKALQCPKSNCGFWHIDELMFATHPHSKHQCNGCGRFFWDTDQPSISNPLVLAAEQLGIPSTPAPVRVDRPLAIASSDFAAVAMWPSNRAILTNNTEPEDEGIHVHAWDSRGQLVRDETYWPVVLDGEPIDLDQLRALAVQKELAHGAPILNLPCDGCGAAILSPPPGKVEPVTRHSCSACGATTKTRLRVMLNPLAVKAPG